MTASDGCSFQKTKHNVAQIGNSDIPKCVHQSPPITRFDVCEAVFTGLVFVLRGRFHQIQHQIEELVELNFELSSSTTHSEGTPLKQ